jgi:predicted enzyme related to lactoylglutathione lyase
MKNAINWFEIPAQDFDRAVAFYSALIGSEMYREVFNGIPNAFFPADREGVGGSIVFDPNVKPAEHGTVVYLNAGNDIDAMLARVEAAGGQIILGKTPIPPQGYMAFIRDTEGNRVGLHMPEQG